MHIELNEAEISHFLLPREGVIEAYVVENPDSDEITDFVSFYSLPSSILRHENHKTLNVAYSYYYFTGNYSLTELTRDALTCAKKKGYDVFNALDIMKNSEYMEELKFGVGDGNLHYYFYNWRVNNLTP